MNQTERNIIIRALRSGVVPKIGLQYIQVGRLQEIKALLQDFEGLCNGGAIFRLIEGVYGSGKTFFLYLMKNVAFAKGLVTATADLSPDQRFHSTQGQARKLCTELIHNLSVAKSPNGGALKLILNQYIHTLKLDTKTQNLTEEKVLQKRLAEFAEYPCGFDFAAVVRLYYQADRQGDDETASSAIKWFSAEYSSKIEARRDLGVRMIVNDENWYDYLKLLAIFIRQAGYKGLLVEIDEMVNLYRISNSRTRQNNYEQILRILNDCLQGNASSIGFLLGATPDFISDTTRGLFCYEALRSRLAQNAFSGIKGAVDYSAPILHLETLEQEDLLVLLEKLRDIYCTEDTLKSKITMDVLLAFMNHCFNKIGAAYYKTPRNTVKAFLDMLAILDQNPQLDISDLIGETVVAEDKAPALLPIDDDLQTYTI